ncbi:MAG: ferric reductase-like transmembrane domain-containing protein [Candidatus Yonathbacteria bacterium]|nr:ferric reductase-like transmembrane domain-containing protein [Candidatus Yonathbacteria bacterium]
MLIRPKIIITVAILVLVFGYAIIRYNVIKGVSWGELPLFISNKAVALSAVAFIALSYALGSFARFWPKIFSTILPLRKFLGLFGFGLAAIHLLISLLIFTPAYYPKFFLASGNLSLVGELAMLFGVLAFAVFALVAISSIPALVQSMDPARWIRVQRLGYLGLVLVFAHVLVMGFEGWISLASWPGGLLPISLIAAIVIAVVLFIKIIALIFTRE